MGGVPGPACAIIDGCGLDMGIFLSYTRWIWGSGGSGVVIEDCRVTMGIFS